MAEESYTFYFKDCSINPMVPWVGSPDTLKTPEIIIKEELPVADRCIANGDGFIPLPFTVDGEGGETTITGIFYVTDPPDRNPNTKFLILMLNEAETDGIGISTIRANATGAANWRLGYKKNNIWYWPGNGSEGSELDDKWRISRIEFTHLDSSPSAGYSVYDEESGVQVGGSGLNETDIIGINGGMTKIIWQNVLDGSIWDEIENGFSWGTFSYNNPTIIPPEPVEPPEYPTEYITRTPKPEINEVYSWYTDILQTMLNEQRVSVRPYPRIELEYSYCIDEEDFRKFLLQMERIGASKFYIPIWSGHLKIKDVEAGESIIDTSGDTKALPLHCGYADQKLIIINPDGSYEAVEFDSFIDDTSFNIKDPLIAPHYNAIIAVYVESNFIGNLSYNYHDSEVYIVKIVAVSTDALTFPTYDDVDRPTFKDSIVVDMPSITAGIHKESYDIPVTKIDNVSGIISTRLYHRRPNYNSPYKIKRLTQEDLWNFKAIFNAVRGRQKGFWLSTWRDDLTLVAPVSFFDSICYIKRIGYEQQLPSNYIIFGENYDRILEIATIEQEDSGTDKVTFTTEVHLDISIGTRMSFVFYSRFNQDDFKINYSPGGGFQGTLLTKRIDE